jgi:hypothetical protein
VNGILRVPRQAGQPRKRFVQAGQRFGRGIVTDPEIRIPRANGHGADRGARLRCDCGAEYATTIANLLKEGHTKSCGCWRRDQAAEWAATGHPASTHRLSKHLLFNTWRRMVDRCENPAHPAYHRYGGRGISVCAGWHDVAVFIADIERVLGPRPDGRTLDRIDNDRNYEPGNVRWATPKEQAANRSSS